MSRLPGYLLLALAMLLGTVVAGSDKPGFVEGHINIGPLTPVQRKDAPTKISPEVYAALRVSVFQADGKTSVAPLAPDADGNFRQSLPPGTYIIDMPHGRMTKVNLPRTITIVPDQTVRVDIEIDTGIR